MVRLSICIPTYNRAVELRPLLDTIVAQTGHGLDVEIVISDNASTDNTPCGRGRICGCGRQHRV